MSVVTGIVVARQRSVLAPPEWSIWPAMRLIFGLPMKPATKTFAGSA